ncbi:MAG TPA: MotA/TolQ/ExbB proton channel family protein [Chloroflexi bacterium]|nr:MotA/TolQ/ExbB proton channel family protein [Chloroflexota bacterium]
MDNLLLNFLAPVDNLLYLGGTVMWAIFIATGLMWALILERYLYSFLQLPKERRRWISLWKERQDHHSWYAKQVRSYLLAEAMHDTHRHLALIRTLASLLPLLGLLGTVVGMVRTFDVMAVFGTGNVRGMAEGISQALITTLAGLVGTLSGLYFSSHLDHRAQREQEFLAEALELHPAGRE